MLHYLKFVLFVCAVWLLNTSSVAQHNFKLKRVKNINLYGNSNPGSFVTISGSVYFAADDGVHGRELWTTDGTDQGTYMIKDINPTGDGVTFRMYQANGKFFFNGDNGVDGIELWVSDGTSQGTKMVKEINLGPDPYGSKIDGASINVFGEFQNQLYFSANDGIHGVEMWVSDGTEIGTKLLKDINPEGYNVDQTMTSIMMGGTEYNNQFYFTATDSVHGFELWATDGTTAGTHMVKDINLHGDGYPLFFCEFKGQLYFTAADSNGNELWVSDGTSLGTKLFANINQDTVGYKSSDPMMYMEYNENLYFLASPDYPNTHKLFYLDEIGGNVNEVLVDLKVSWSSWRRYVFHNKIFFSGFNAEFGAEPWVTDNEFVTSDLLADIDTFMISPLSGQTQSSSPAHYFEFNDFLIFKASDRLGGGRQLWVYDDNMDTLQPLWRYSAHQVYNSAHSFTSEYGVIVNGNSCYIIGEYDSSGIELWRLYDSTAVGIEENKPILQSNIKVFPNPNVGNFITLELNEVFEGAIQIEMLDLLGKRINQWDEISTPNQHIQIPTKGLKQGVYFIKVSSENYEETVRFVKL